MLTRWRTRWAWLDSALTVNERFGAVGGGTLAAAIALAAFLSLFPLLLVAVAVVGFWSAGDATVAERIVRDLGIEGSAAEMVTESIGTAEGSRRAASVIGLVGLLWSGLGVVGTLQTGINSAWQVTGRGIRDKAVALAWAVGAGLLLLASLAVGPVLASVHALLAVVAIPLGLALSTLLFVWTFSFLGNQPVPWRAHLPGAVLVAVGLEVLKAVGTYYVPRVVASSSALYGSIGVVFAILAWLLIYGRLIMYGATLNVVRWEADQGTVVVDLEVPRIDGEVPLTATRGGAVQER